MKLKDELLKSQSMKLKDLLLGCMNQWSGPLTYNKNFKVIVRVYLDKEEYIFNVDYPQDENYQKIRTMEVVYWEMLDKDTIEVVIDKD